MLVQLISDLLSFYNFSPVFSVLSHMLLSWACTSVSVALTHGGVITSAGHIYATILLASSMSP